jgi:2-polyprenyl-6-methoxyphenol hydroxylase-like FAD-dependent oxidoreductase
MRAFNKRILQRWYRPGLLLIGDAAHVMTPVGGVGINYAIQDAVAAANILTPGLQEGKARTSDLARVQRRRKGPTKIIQSFQRFMQREIQAGIISPQGTPTLPLLFSLLLHTPVLRNLPARLISFGIQRERVKNP